MSWTIVTWILIAVCAVSYLPIFIERRQSIRLRRWKTTLAAIGAISVLGLIAVVLRGYLAHRWDRLGWAVLFCGAIFFAHLRHNRKSNEQLFDVTVWNDQGDEVVKHPAMTRDESDEISNQWKDDPSKIVTVVERKWWRLSH